MAEKQLKMEKTDEGGMTEEESATNTRPGVRTDLSTMGGDTDLSPSDTRSYTHWPDWYHTRPIRDERSVDKALGISKLVCLPRGMT